MLQGIQCLTPCGMSVTLSDCVCVCVPCLCTVHRSSPRMILSSRRRSCTAPAWGMRRTRPHVSRRGSSHGPLIPSGPPRPMPVSMTAVHSNLAVMVPAHPHSLVSPPMPINMTTVHACSYAAAGCGAGRQVMEGHVQQLQEPPLPQQQLLWQQQEDCNRL